MKVTTIIGARPQFIKAAPLSEALKRAGIKETLVHTGQHYDYEMSEIFFKELGIPAPAVNLDLGGGGHGEMTAAMLTGVEKLLLEDRPDWLIIFGDTNSTLAGALAAAKLHIPIVHVEAGLRSFNRKMPEEVNRVLADHVSTLLLCPNEGSKELLKNEGIEDGVHVVGDVMVDANKRARDIVAEDIDSYISDDLKNVVTGNYALLTLHRAENTNDKQRLYDIITQLNELSMPIIFPIHPRTRIVMENEGLFFKDHVYLTKPLGYLNMMALLSKAKVVLSDSGGLQKEAFWAKVPCVTLRTETEWVETVESGWNQIIGDDVLSICDRVTNIKTPDTHENYYGEDVADKIVALLHEG